MGLPRSPNGWYILPQSDIYMESSEGKHWLKHGAPIPTIPWSALDRAELYAGPGEVMLKISRAGGSPANLAKAQLYPRCSGWGSAPLSLDFPTHGSISVHGEDKGSYTRQR